jgi:hypothetical protein
LIICAYFLPFCSMRVLFLSPTPLSNGSTATRVIHHTGSAVLVMHLSPSLALAFPCLLRSAPARVASSYGSGGAAKPTYGVRDCCAVAALRAAVPSRFRLSPSPPFRHSRVPSSATLMHFLTALPQGREKEDLYRCEERERARRRRGRKAGRERGTRTSRRVLPSDRGRTPPAA